MLKSVVAAVLLASLVGAPNVADPPQPQAPGRVTIEPVTYNGLGCAPGQVSTWVSPDNDYLGVVYSNYIAWIGPRATPIDFRKNCQVALGVRVPPGWSYAVTGYTHVGTVNLATGASAQLRVNSYFAGRATTPILRYHMLTGPLNDEISVDETTDVEQLQYSRCNVPETLVISTDLRILAGTSAPKLVDSYFALEFTRDIHLVFRPCTPTA